MKEPKLLQMIESIKVLSVKPGSVVFVKFKEEMSDDAMAKIRRWFHRVGGMAQIYFICTDKTHDFDLEVVEKAEEAKEESDPCMSCSQMKDVPPGGYIVPRCYMEYRQYDKQSTSLVPPDNSDPEKCSYYIRATALNEIETPIHQKIDFALPKMKENHEA